MWKQQCFTLCQSFYSQTYGPIPGKYIQSAMTQTSPSFFCAKHLLNTLHVCYCIWWPMMHSIMSRYYYLLYRKSLWTDLSGLLLLQLFKVVVVVECTERNSILPWYVYFLFLIYCWDINYLHKPKILQPWFTLWRGLGPVNMLTSPPPSFLSL